MTTASAFIASAVANRLALALALLVAYPLATRLETILLFLLQKLLRALTRVAVLAATTAGLYVVLAWFLESSPYSPLPWLTSSVVQFLLHSVVYYGEYVLLTLQTDVAGTVGAVGAAVKDNSKAFLNWTLY